MKVCISWTGKIVELSDIESILSDFTPNNYIFLLGTGEPWNIETGARVNEEEYVIVFQFPLMGADERANSFEEDLLNSALTMSPVNDFAHYEPIALKGLSMDEQITCLRDYLRSAIDKAFNSTIHLDKLCFILSDLSERNWGIVLSGNAACKNCQINAETILTEFRTTDKLAEETSEKIGALLQRCLTDFALMKEIKVSLPNSQLPERTSLFDLKGVEWNEKYLECAKLRDLLCTEKREVEVLAQSISLPNLSALPSKHGHWRDDIESLKREIDGTSKVLELPEGFHEGGENFEIVKNSSYLLKLAEAFKAMNPIYERIKTFNFQMRNQIKELISRNEANLTHQRELFLAVIESQKTLNILKEKLQNSMTLCRLLGENFACLERIHSFPVAYVAFKCEQLRRANFRKGLHSSIARLNQCLEKLVLDEEKMRLSIRNDLASIIEPELLGDSSNKLPKFSLKLSPPENALHEYPLDHIELEEMIQNLVEKIRDVKDPDMAHQVGKFVDLIENMRIQVSTQFGNLTDLLGAPPHELEHVDQERENALNKLESFIKIDRLENGDRVLILPTTKDDVWSIFNLSKGRYFINKKCIQDALKTKAKWGIGTIESMRQCESQGKKSSEYYLPKGFRYFEVYLQMLSTSPD